MIAAPLFGWSIRAIGVRATLGGFAVVLAVTGVIAAWLIAHSGVALGAASTTIVPDEAERRRSVFWRLCIVFFLAASAGIMVLSQAAGIITAYGGGTALAVYGTTFIAATIAVARLGGGWMVDWLTIPVVAAGAHPLAGPRRFGPRAGAGRAGLRRHFRPHGRRGGRVLAARVVRTDGEPDL